MTGSVPASSASMVECDFLVIGAGIAGASAAWALGEHGSVVVLERESSAGYHTTGRSAAQFLQSYGNLSTRCLTRGGRPFFESPPDGFAETPLLSPRSALFFAREDQIDALRALHATVSALTPEVALIDAKEACALVPVLRIDYVAGGDAGAGLDGHRRERAPPGLPARRAPARRSHRASTPRSGRSGTGTHAGKRAPATAATRRRLSSTPPARGVTRSPGSPARGRSDWFRNGGPSSPSIRRPVRGATRGRSASTSTRSCSSSPTPAA